VNAVIRTLAFIRKEAAEVVRQPQLLLLLVLGPFIVLLLFGAGLRELDPPVRTVFVAPEGSELTADVVEFAQAQSGRLIVEGVISDEDEALRRLRTGDVQLVVAFPEEVRETVRRDDQAVITLYHTEIDPVEGRALELFMQTAVDEANRQVLGDAVGEAQTESGDLHEQVAQARERTARLRTAAEDDGPGGEAELAGLRGQLAAVALAAGPVLAILDSSEANGSSALAERLDRLDELVGTFDRTTADDLDPEEVAELDEQLTDLDETLTEFRGLSPGVVVAPFRGEAVRVAAEDVELSDFYAPAVAVVLLQHLLVTALGLSLVRESALGTTELYRVAPLRPGEIVIGKYLAHMLLALVVGGVLIAALVLGLGVPLRGDPVLLGLALLAVVFASAGLGFLTSLAARSDSQAVQYAMLVLLVTVFFSGFLLSLERFIPAIGWISWLVPATYGIELLRDIMLRGAQADPALLGGLAAYGLGVGLVSWIWLRHRLRTR
jgi:ABC-2 type transport system permease protein